MRTAAGPMAGGALSLPPGCAARPGSAGAPRAVAAATLEPCRKSRRDNPLLWSLESFIGYVLPWVNPRVESGDGDCKRRQGQGQGICGKKIRFLAQSREDANKGFGKQRQYHQMRVLMCP